MIEVKIIHQENYFTNNSIENNCYRVVAEEAGVRSFGFLIKYFDINFWKGKIFCGKDCFYKIPVNSSALSFSSNYGNYFSDKYKVGIFEPCDSLAQKIDAFNKSNSLNPLLAKHNKPLKPVPIFTMEELINNCNLVFIEELYSGHNGFSIVFFQSDFFNSKDYIIKFLKLRNLNVIDTTA